MFYNTTFFLYVCVILSRAHLIFSYSFAFLSMLVFLCDINFHCFIAFLVFSFLFYCFLHISLSFSRFFLFSFPDHLFVRFVLRLCIRLSASRVIPDSPLRAYLGWQPLQFRRLR